MTIIQSKSDAVNGQGSELKAYSLRIALGGQLVELVRRLGRKPYDLSKRKGDVINCYSRESRNRFLKFLLSIDYKQMGNPLFYTLTYPKSYPENPQDWKSHLSAMVRRLKRKYPGVCGTWRLEPQKRGAPHFSGFLWGCDELTTELGKRWFSRQWFEIVDSGDDKHLLAGTGISKELMIETRIYYLAKYQAKSEKGGDKQEFKYPVGRYWGCFGRERLVINVEEFKIDRQLYFRLKRVMRRKLEKKIGKKRYYEVLKGRECGMWVRMSNDTIERLLDLLVED